MSRNSQASSPPRFTCRAPRCVQLAKVERHALHDYFLEEIWCNLVPLWLSSHRDKALQTVRKLPRVRTKRVIYRGARTAPHLAVRAAKVDAGQVLGQARVVPEHVRLQDLLHQDACSHRTTALAPARLHRRRAVPLSDAADKVLRRPSCAQAAREGRRPHLRPRAWPSARARARSGGTCRPGLSRSAVALQDQPAHRVAAWDAARAPAAQRVPGSPPARRLVGAEAERVPAIVAGEAAVQVGGRLHACGRGRRSSASAPVMGCTAWLCPVATYVFALIQLEGWARPLAQAFPAASDKAGLPRVNRQCWPGH